MNSVHGPMTSIRKARIWELWRQGYPMSFIADDMGITFDFEIFYNISI